ncbi:MAG: TonB-dependent receptor [Campylobacterota bacterium]|nr:TonB-dependent receptor [Campylobacterota bacterium]
MKFFIIIQFLIVFIFAQEINLDNLLKKYQDSESLYQKTKQENAGLLISYSREDLEQMQAYKLKDVLKTVRLFNMQLNPIGVISLKKAGASYLSMNPIKLYIDDFEVTSLMQANPIEMYVDMDIYFVDHIEIYQGGSSIAFGNEPGSMVIRLYSKNPNRENSSSTQLSVDSYGGKDLRFVDAGSTDDYDYLSYINIADVKYDTYNLNSKNISKDGKRYQTHFKFSQENNFNIEFDSIVNKGEPSKGLGTSPISDNEVKRAYAYLSATKFFKDNLKISFSISGEIKKVDFKDDIGFILPDGTISNNFNTDINSKIYRAIIEKKIISSNHDLLIGAQYLQKNLDIKDYETDGTTPAFNLDKLNIYMFYLEEQYNINKNNLISFSGKMDFYKNNLSKNSSEYAVRLAYINIFNDNWKTKLFGIRRYVCPNGLQSSFAMPIHKPNPNLHSAIPKTIVSEIEYNDNSKKITFGLAHMVMDSPIVFDFINKQYINSDKTIRYNRMYIRDEYKFDIDNKVTVEYFKLYKDSYASSGSGALIQLFNKIDKFSIYNELVYRDSYSLNSIKIDAGYDWTMSINYPLTKKLNLKAKGENLLDKASETLIDFTTQLKAPVTDRRFIATVEYTF